MEGSQKVRGFAESCRKIRVEKLWKAYDNSQQPCTSYSSGQKSGSFSACSQWPRKLVTHITEMSSGVRVLQESDQQTRIVAVLLVTPPADFE